jgi:hypothetical protein
MYRLDSLRSILRVPGHEDAPIRVLHLSFCEFFVNLCGNGEEEREG